MKCIECCYCWQDEYESYPCCHWESRCPDDKPPCEYDEYDYTRGDDKDGEWI